MSLRTIADRITNRQPQEPPARVPLCGAEPTAADTCAGSGGGFPEILGSPHGTPCVEPAVSIVSFKCPCGHEGWRYSCAVHAEPGPAQNCGHCAEDFMHICTVTLTGTPI